MRLHLIDAGSQLGAWAGRVRAEFPSARGRVLQHLPADDIEVIVYPAGNVIPELGVNAFSEHGNLIRLWLQPQHPQLEHAFSAAFASLLAHEAHHCIRARGPGYGWTLGEAMVSEGLACQFELQATGRLPVYAAAMDPQEVEEGLDRVLPYLRGPRSPAWMFGDESASIPRNFGYRLGAAWVGRWLNARGLTAAAAAQVPAAEFALGASAPAGHP